jgi:hypothetical protein
MKETLACCYITLLKCREKQWHDSNQPDHSPHPLPQRGRCQDFPTYATR